MSDQRGLSSILDRGAAAVLAELELSGLRDRDYESLPTAGRLRAHAAAKGEDKVIIADCADIEPGLRIAGYLLAEHARDVVDGALVAVATTGSRRLVLHVGTDDPVGALAVSGALEEARAIDEPAASRLAEVEIGIVRSPFRQNMKGYEEQPTLVFAAETLVQISRAVTRGAEWFRGNGTEGSPGTKFFQLTGVCRPGVYELPLGVTVRRLVDETGGGVEGGRTLKGVIVGGAKGACLRPDDLDMPLDLDALGRVGGVLGSGEVAVLTSDDCVVDQVRRRLANTCYDTCGKCSLGREGSYQLREMVTDATRGKSRSADVDMMREVGRAMRLACACPSGANAPNPVLTALDNFADEFEAHMRRKKCDTLVCDHYVTFHILPDLCDGCGECVDACPEDAIEGGRKKIHVIDQDSCERCGKCLEVCNGLRKAVVRAGAVKPKTPKRPVPVGTWSG